MVLRCAYGLMIPFFFKKYIGGVHTISEFVCLIFSVVFGHCCSHWTVTSTANIVNLLKHKSYLERILMLKDKPSVFSYAI